MKQRRNWRFSGCSDLVSQKSPLRNRMQPQTRSQRNARNFTGTREICFNDLASSSLIEGSVDIY
jgi:hypothetical protein